MSSQSTEHAASEDEILASTSGPEAESQYSAEHRARLLSFAELTDEWSDVSTWVQQTARLASEPAAFEEAYGSFADEDAVQRFSSAVELAKAVGGELLGTPATLTQHIADDPEYLRGAEPPESVYAYLVWLGHLIQSFASAVTTRFDVITTVLDAGDRSQEEKAGLLRRALTGPNGFIAKATPLVVHAQSASFRLVANQDDISDVMKTIGETELAAEARQAVAAGGDTDESRLKTRFITELAAATRAGDRLMPALINVDHRLEQFAAYVDGSIEQAKRVESVSDDDAISDPHRTRVLLGLPEARVIWEQIGADAARFTQNAQVTETNS